MGLSVNVLDKDKNEIDLKNNFDDEDDFGLPPLIDDEAFSNVEDDMDGYSVEDIPEEDDDFDFSEDDFSDNEEEF